MYYTLAIASSEWVLQLLKMTKFQWWKDVLLNTVLLFLNALENLKKKFPFDLQFFIVIGN